MTVGSAVWCWGLNPTGQLGDGTTTDRLEPGPVPGVRAAALALGSGFTCALDELGEVWCWGDNSSGQLGIPVDHEHPAWQYSAVPVRVEGLPPLATISASEGTACGTTSDARTYCWGDNYSSMLGRGSTGHVPSEIEEYRGAVQVALGDSHTCALFPDGTVWCMGHALVPGSNMTLADLRQVEFLE